MKHDDAPAPDAAPASMDALVLLRHQHLEVEELFRELEHFQAKALGSPASYLSERKNLTDSLIRQLSVHSGIEETHFYPALREYVGDGDPLADEAVHQHQEAKQVLKALDGISPDNLDYDGRLRELMQSVREHVKVEEQEIFPRIRAALTDGQLGDLGQRLQKAMRTAPTRPHPGAPPSTSAMGKVAAMGAAVVDRMRDASDGRHH